MTGALAAGLALLPLIITATLILLSVLALNAAIRIGLRAPRLRSESDPSSLDLPYQNVRLPTANNKHLQGWLIPGTSGLPTPTLIVLHGWGSNSGMMLPLAKPFCLAGYTLLFIDARNHGASEGDTFSSLPRFAEDLESAMDWLRLQPGTDPNRIGLIGHSVGAAAALLVASRREDIAVVVSLAAFAHPGRMMRRYLATRSVPYIPLGWYTLKYIQHVIGYCFDDIAPQNTISKITCPVLLAHGKNDSTVPAEDAALIHAGSRKEITRLLLVDGDHEDYAGLQSQSEDMLKFVNEAMRDTRQNRC